MSGNPLFNELLKARGLTNKTKQRLFLLPDYDSFCHDPFLLPDMKAAVERLVLAQKRHEKVVIYGDYDIDGLTATTLLLDTFVSFGFQVDSFIPSRFEDGYGLSQRAIEAIAKEGGQVIVTVDCGSLSFEEINRANKLGMDVIVTDHHTVADTMPSAVAVINPKRPDHSYPFADLAGVGVAFKLVQALQTKLKGIPAGQEKWLLDLVALGTVCDIVTLVDENRCNVLWGLKVLAKTRRPGLRALMAVAGIKPEQLNARALGFGLGPRLNASGRLKTAKLSLELLQSTDSMRALTIAQELDKMNKERRRDQDVIVKAAIEQAVAFTDSPVLVLSHSDWSHGIVGIVAAKMLERFKKPTFVLQELGDETKGSARSYGDFSAVAAIRASEQWVIKGGGHTLAAGVTLKTIHIAEFRKAVNSYYHSLGLNNQLRYLEPNAEVVSSNFTDVNEELLNLIDQLQPFGHGNLEPVFCFQNVTLLTIRKMGDAGQHVRLTLQDKNGKNLNVVDFNANQSYDELIGEKVDVWCNLTLNEWKGNRSVEGRLLQLTSTTIE